MSEWIKRYLADEGKRNDDRETFDWWTLYTDAQDWSIDGTECYFCEDEIDWQVHVASGTTYAHPGCFYTAQRLCGLEPSVHTENGALLTPLPLEQG